MSNSHGITKDSLLRTLPSVLAGDKSVEALAEAAAEVLAGRIEEIEKLNIYAHIDELPEELLDTLAYDYKVDWWDYDSSLSEKRQTLRDSWKVHRILGTKAAVETAVQAICPSASINEWYEYGSTHHYFRISITEAETVDYAAILDIIEITKRKGAWLEGFLHQREMTANVSVAIMEQTAYGVHVWDDSEAPVLEVVLTLDPEYKLSLAAPGVTDNVRNIRVVGPDGMEEE